MTSLLIFTDWFTPAYKAGGPIASIRNLVSLIEGSITCWVVTSDEDILEETLKVEVNQWLPFGNGHVIYLSDAKRNLKTIQQLMKDLKPDAIYCNSMFSMMFSIMPLWYARHQRIKAILAPRGMLKNSALAVKQLKKKAFLSLFKLVGGHRSIIFHATTSEEKAQIEVIFGPQIDCRVIANVPQKPAANIQYISKIPPLRLLLIGRIHPIKGLHQVPMFLLGLEDRVTLTIAGVLEDEAYWTEIKSDLQRQEIEFIYVGALPPEEMSAVIDNHHALILPTKGENFGHAIFEAFAAGRPVLISDQTPWRNLEHKKVGFDIPLDDQEGWNRAIQMIIQMDQEEYNVWCENALQYAKRFFKENDLKKKYLELFSV